MSWGCGYDYSWHRDIGYGVPAWCDHPDCSEEIDRGLSFVCGGEPYGGEKGCGLYFCSRHMWVDDLCDRCKEGLGPFEPKPDHPEWARHKLTHTSWAQWRRENPAEVADLRLNFAGGAA